VTGSPGRHGGTSPPRLLQGLRPNTQMISVMMANNEIVLDLLEAGEIETRLQRLESVKGIVA